MSAAQELTDAINWAVLMWHQEGDTRTWQAHPGAECSCTVQVDDPDNVHLFVSFSCPRHAEHARQLRDFYGGRA